MLETADFQLIFQSFRIGGGEILAFLYLFKILKLPPCPQCVRTKSSTCHETALQINGK